VNLWSKHAQELPGLPSRLLDAEDGTRTTLQRARDHLGAGAPDYLTDDGDTLFIRLVMLRQLQRAYGRDLFRAVNRHFRAAPLPFTAGDQDKVDAFVLAICNLTGHDLRPFFGPLGSGDQRRA